MKRTLSILLRNPLSAPGLFLGLSLAHNERAPSEVELFADGVHIATAAYETGDVSRGMLSAGQALGLTGDIAPLAGIVGGLEEEALAALARLRPVPARIKEGIAV